MMLRRWVHLITVGASIAQNALRMGVGSLGELDVGDLGGLEEALGSGVLSLEELAEELFKVVLESPKAMSAELNTCLDVLREGFELRRVQLIYLFHTDTWIGRLCGGVLYRFFEEVSVRDFDGLVACQEPVEVEGLGDSRRFREGLANLLGLIAEYIASFKKMGDRVLIHATGGFKPESAMALLAANLPGLGAPVLYIHEYFREVVRIPAIPLSPRLERVFGGLMDRVLQVDRAYRGQLEREFGGDLVDEAIKLGWLIEDGEYIKPSRMGVLIWRRLPRLKRRRLKRR